MNDMIKTGDVVQLKSGGPLMTVGAMGPKKLADDTDLAAGEVACTWFVPMASVTTRAEPFYSHASSGFFHVDMLRKVTVDLAPGKVHQ